MSKLNLKGIDVVVYIISSIVGYVSGAYVFLHYPEYPLLAYCVMILLPFHLFLAWLVITAEKETGLLLPIFMTILTHLSCLTLVIALSLLRHIPILGLFIRYGLPAVAVFERSWLFSGGRKKKEAPPVKASTSAAVPSVVVQATAEDYDAWLQYLATRNPLSRKSGHSIQDEYQQWLYARAKARGGVTTSNPSA
jgi:hypothetical protein